MIDELLVEVAGLGRSYGRHAALRDLTLTVRAGEVLGLLGTNGAGKTTTLNLIAGVLAPTAGTVRIAGQDLAEEPLAAKAALGYLPEIPPLYPELTVDEFLDHAAALRGVPRRARGDARERAKARCGLGLYGERLVSQLSKGYGQRVGIAQAVVHEPRVLLLDEPTVGLDPNQLREMRDTIRELGRERAVILSSHLLGEVAATCTRVVVIHEGAVVHEGPVDDAVALERRFQELTA